MPTFECDECGKKFNSKKKKDEHVETAHGNKQATGGISGLPTRIMNNKKQFITLIFGGMMVFGLMFGATIFYSSIGPERNPGNYTTNPPTGRNIRSVSEVEDIELPNQTIVYSPLSKDEQVATLLRGGPVDMGEGLKPAVLIQYSCMTCKEQIKKIANFTGRFNQGRNWVYLAPYPDMNSSISLTSYGRIQEYEEFDRNDTKKFACGSLGNEPISCIETDIGS
ncbi:MAG: hypothetical protein MUP58_01270 [Candidatus Nanohaloarchaeota archaeon QJJ-9]|nr:hypothetical protein [Candidatus Nanohaloarchaeota archaeon QJJ-9]